MMCGRSDLGIYCRKAANAQLLVKGLRMFRLLTFSTVVGVLVLWGVLGPPAFAAPAELLQGIEAARNGRLDVATELWSRTIRKDPKCYAAWVNRGSAYIRRGYVYRAIMDWHKAIQLSPIFAYGVHTGDFIRHASAGKPILNYAVAIELDPEHFPSVAMTGATLQDLGLTKMAVELFRKSVDLTKNPLLKSHLDYWANSLESLEDKNGR